MYHAYKVVDCSYQDQQQREWWMNRGLHAWRDRHTDRQMDRRMNGRINERINAWLDGRTHRQMDRQMHIRAFMHDA